MKASRVMEERIEKAFHRRFGEPEGDRFQRGDVVFAFRDGYLAGYRAGRRNKKFAKFDDVKRRAK